MLCVCAVDMGTVCVVGWPCRLLVCVVYHVWVVCGRAGTCMCCMGDLHVYAFVCVKEGDIRDYRRGCSVVTGFEDLCIVMRMDSSVHSLKDL